MIDELLNSQRPAPKGFTVEEKAPLTLQLGIRGVMSKHPIRFDFGQFYDIPEMVAATTTKV